MEGGIENAWRGSQFKIGKLPTDFTEMMTFEQ